MSGTKPLDVRDYYSSYVNPYLGEMLAKIGLDKVFVEGEGPYLIDDKGVSYLDFVSNYGSTLLGHNYPDIISTINEFILEKKPVFVQPSIGVEAAILARKLVKYAPKSLRKVVFTNSGAESVELSLKVARAVTTRRYVLSTKNSFHGKTISALSATGQSSYQGPYGLPLEGFHYIQYGDAEELEDVLKNNAELYAAFIVEPIQGEGGVVQAKAEYFCKVQSLCQQYGVKLIVDEVQTGIGRTGHMFYSNHLGLQPDAITLAKGLGGGMLPMGAVLLKDEMYIDDIGLTHSSTFAGNGLSCRVGNVVIDTLRANDQEILRWVREIGAYLKQRLVQLQLSYPHVLAEIRGDGLMLGIEFGVNAETYKGDRGSMLGVAAGSGMLLPLISGYLANIHHIRVAPTLNSKKTLRVQPPLNISREQCDIFYNALHETVRHLSSGSTDALARYFCKSGQVRNRCKIINKEYKFRSFPTDNDGRFGFLVHPLTLKGWQGFDSSLASMSPPEMRELTDLFGNRLDPAFIGSCRITAKNGDAIYGEYAAVPYLPEQMLSMPQDDVINCINKAILMLKDRGAKIIGLGGYTSIVTKGGKLSSKLGVAVTTGNNYTVLSAIMAAREAIELMSSGSLENINVAIVGAGGSIGSTITREIACSVDQVTLIGNWRNVDKTQKRISEILYDLCELLCFDKQFQTAIQKGTVADRLHVFLHGQRKVDHESIQLVVAGIMAGEFPDIGIIWGSDVDYLLPKSDVVFVATNSTDILIHPHNLKRNAIVCDLSRPSNVNHIISLHRPDVFIIDGGVIKTPNLDEIGINIGFPKGYCLACMAETMMLAFDRRYENTSIGARLKYKDQAYFKQKAEAYGFSIAGFRSFDLPITDAALERTRQARKYSRVDTGLDIDFMDYGNIVKFVFEQHAHAGNSAIAFHGDEAIAFDTAYSWIRKYATAYLSIGCVKGDHIAILAEGDVHTVFAIFGCFYMGAVAVVLNPNSSHDEISAALKNPAQKLLVDGNVEISDFSVDSIQLSVLTELAKRSRECAQVASVTCDYPASIFCTQGSTGTQKMVCHSHGDIFNTFKNYGRGVLGLNQYDRILSTSKCYFIYGFKSIYLGLACGGGAILAPSRPTSHAIGKIVSRLNPTYIFSVPTIYLRLLQNPVDVEAFKSVKYFVSAGEPLPRHVHDRWRRRYNKNILEALGTTESMCFVISNYPDDMNPGSTGKPVPGYQMRLVNKKEQEARAGELGTLWIKGSTVVDHYIDDEPKYQRNCFVDGWYNTNDVFYRDDIGWYYFQGRANEMAKVGGEWLSTSLIEEALIKHPAVKCSAVKLFNQVGLLNRPIAYVVPVSTENDRESLASDLKTYCRKVLSRNHYPHVIEMVDELPMKNSDCKKQREPMMRHSN